MTKLNFKCSEKLAKHLKLCFNKSKIKHFGTVHITPCGKTNFYNVYFSDKNEQKVKMVQSFLRLQISLVLSEDTYFIPVCK